MSKEFISARKGKKKKDNSDGIWKIWGGQITVLKSWSRLAAVKLRLGAGEGVCRAAVRENQVPAGSKAEQSPQSQTGEEQGDQRGRRGTDKRKAAAEAGLGGDASRAS